MSVNNITDVKTFYQSEQKTNLSSNDDDGLFQQLLQSSTSQTMNNDGKLHPNIKGKVADGCESDELEQDLDIVAMLLPSLERLDDNPNKFMEGKLIKNDSFPALTSLIDNNLNQEAFIVNHDIDVNQSIINANQLTSIMLPNKGLHTITEAIQQDIDNSKFAQKGELTAGSSGFEALMLESETNGQYSDDVNNIIKNKVFDSNSLANVANNKSMLMNTNQISSLGMETHVQNQPLTPTTVATHTLNLSTPINNVTQWQTTLAQQIVMFSRQDIKTAEIKLHPEELGSLHIKLAMDEDKMHLHMMVAQTVVKGVLESALPHLRTSLEEQGITLQQADISDFSMMNNSQQSELFKQPENAKQQVSLVDTEEQLLDQLSVNKDLVPTGLSIFA